MKPTKDKKAATKPRKASARKPAPEKRPPGRPSDFTAEKAAEICSRLADGESLRTICAGEHMPARKTVFQWIFKHPEFADQYAQARSIQAESMAEELLEIADDGSNDWMERTGKDGESLGWVLNGEHVNRSRLRVDTRKWVASKLLPKRYGDKLEVGGNPDSPLVIYNVKF